MKKQQPFYRTLWGQVLAAVAVAIVLGHFWPDTGIAMKVLGDSFIPPSMAGRTSGGEKSCKTTAWMPEIESGLAFPALRETR